VSAQAVITGVAAVTALGASAEETFDALCSGRSAVGPVRGFDASIFACPAAAQAAGLDAASLGVAPRDARTMGFHSFALLAVARSLHAAARLDDPAVPRERIGFFTGMGMVDCEPADLLPAALRSRGQEGALDYDKFYNAEFQHMHPLWPLSMLNNMALAQAAIDLDIRGDNSTFSPFGESGALALREAERSAAEGSALAALAAGVSEKVSPQSMARHQCLAVLSPSGRPAPFGSGRDGAVPGEAAAGVVFETAQSAAARGLKPLAAMPGWAMTFAPTRDEDCLARAMADAMRGALDMAGASPGQAAVLFAQADGSRAADAAEARAIREVLGPEAVVTSTKAALGNTLAASAPLDVAFAVLALARGAAPGCCSGPADESLGIRLAPAGATAVSGDTALVNVRGLGGQCASLVVRAWKE